MMYETVNLVAVLHHVQFCLAAQRIQLKSVCGVRGRTGAIDPCLRGDWDTIMGLAIARHVLKQLP